ncbi:MAG: polyprenyl synthetase family protein [Hyphomicrobiales bacterium]
MSTAVPEFAHRLSAAAAEIEALLSGLLPGHDDRLTAAMAYALLGGGKRLRPFLVIESAALFDAPRQNALWAGAALECIHCYSLVHDDLPAMDDDDLRRGKPTVHKAFDEATAILAGDALQALAFDILGRPETHRDPAVRIELVRELASAAGHRGMAGGQMLDLTAPQAGFDLPQVMRMQTMKTGALFRFASVAGAILGRVSPEEKLALGRYGEAIGLAFQVADDILDVESSAERLGKTTQKDERAGKATYVDLLGLDDAKRTARDLAERGKAELAGFGSRAGALAGVADFVVQRAA